SSPPCGPRRARGRTRRLRGGRRARRRRRRRRAGGGGRSRRLPVGPGRAGGVAAALAGLAGAGELLRDGEAEGVAGERGGGVGGRVDLGHGVGAGLADAADLGVDVGGHEPVGGRGPVGVDGGLPVGGGDALVERGGPSPGGLLGDVAVVGRRGVGKERGGDGGGGGHQSFPFAQKAQKIGEGQRLCRVGRGVSMAIQSGRLLNWKRHRLPFSGRRQSTYTTRSQDRTRPAPTFITAISRWLILSRFTLRLLR